MLARWTAKERDVIFMFFTSQIAVREAASILGRRRMTMQRWLVDVKKKFREELSAYGY
jgi:DNA-directed RNA polymerase specialized sigma24 family protein